ncbi:UNVERIFIED_CONTAM: cytochrome [Sesamum latifolium]|uniref:Cytochrome n=1 Tax=Sesamum latifolium TaxID=2727402 RepID=A0AAW2WXH7_9LAMI
MHLLIDYALIASAAVFALSVSWQVWKLIKSHKKLPGLPPGPGGLLIVGYLPYVRPNIHIQFTELAQKYGPIYKLWLGKKLCIMISSPSLIKEVLRDHDTIFANRDKTVTALIGTYNAMTSAGPVTALNGGCCVDCSCGRCWVLIALMAPAISGEMKLGRTSEMSLRRLAGLSIYVN